MTQPADIKIPGYRIEGLLGKGGMATVYLATQMSLGRSVALKVLNDPETPLFFERFFNEGRCISKLSHPNLVHIYDIGQGDGFFYIAMEYIPGGDLKTRIIKGIKPGAAFKLMSRMALCLSYVHNADIVHRDIKPSNILFRDDGTPVLTDFGIAKLTQSDSDLTITGTVLGSPHYLSPEQAQGKQSLDGRSDLYSLGVIFFEMLTGKKPFSAENFAATLLAHINDPIPKLPAHLAYLQPLIDKLLAKQPAQRFQSGTELANSLEPYREMARKASQDQAGSQPTTSPKQNPEPGRRFLLPLLVIGIAAIIAIPMAWRSSNVTPAPDTTTVTPDSTIATSSEPPATELSLSSTTGPAAEQFSSNTPADADHEIDVAEGTPSNTETTQASNELSLLLQKAEQLFREDHLSFPAGNNARNTFQQALKIDPENRTAKQGLVRIADRYLELAQQQYQRGRRMRAERYVNLGLAIEPKHRGLLRLDKKLVQAANTSNAADDSFDWSRINPNIGN